MVRRAWTRDELLVAFNLYCKIPFGRIHKENPEIIKLASYIGRTPSSVAMKLVNFASLDPIQKQRNIKGLSNASRADRLIFEEFARNWNKTALESEIKIDQFKSSDHKLNNRAKDIKTPKGHTETSRLVKVRKVQNFFRTSVLISYFFKCAMCDLAVSELLNASHIIPWKDDEKRRADPTNGISLCTLHDRAFDRGLVSIDDDLKIIISSSLQIKTENNVHQYAFLCIQGKKLSTPNRFAPDRKALEYHRKRIFIENS